MIIRSVLVWLLCAATCVAAEVRKAVAFSALPPAVQMTIQRQAGNFAPVGIERVEEDGEVSYEMEVTAGGRKRGITVGEDGKLLSIGVALAETPAAVQRAVKAQVGAGALVNVDKIFDAGAASYDVLMTTKDGQERTFIVEENGTISSLEVALAETPAAVQKTVTAQVGAGKLDGITKISDEDITYDVEMTAANGKEREFSVAADGKLLSIRVNLEDLIADVQKTIREQVGTGRILRIEKSFVKRDKVDPYDVEAIRNGKPFYFSVGPKGRFLGADE